MIRWLFKGIFRDKSRSLFPFIVVTTGVALVIGLVGFMEGTFMGMIDMTANLDTGHLRFVNKPFYEEEHLNPLDRALAAQTQTRRWLTRQTGPEVTWVPRIRWGAILDVPDERGETMSQTPVMGLGLNLGSPDSTERQRLRLEESLIQGRLPENPKEMLVGYELAETLDLELGKPVTLLGRTFDGGLAADNYRMVGSIRFGVFAMDKKMVLIDLADAQDTFYMKNMVTDWLGYFDRQVPFDRYEEVKENLQEALREWMHSPPAEWAADDRPIVLSIRDQRNIGAITDKFRVIKHFIVGIFTFLMVLVLWNAGILNGIHRYGEMGLRLAFGERPRHLILTLVVEGLLIGLLGAAAGSLIGGAFTYYLQEVGLNMGDSFAKTGLMIQDVVRARVSVEGFIQGIVPGIVASALGTLVASLAIFKRSEANLFRELEAG